MGLAVEEHQLDPPNYCQHSVWCLGVDTRQQFLVIQRVCDEVLPYSFMINILHRLTADVSS